MVDNSVAITIKTKDRSPAKNYLRQTLDNLARAGVLDSPLLHSYEIVATEETDPPRSLQANASRAIQLAAEKDAGWCLVLEDDLDFCDQFLDSLVKWLIDHARKNYKGFFALGANYAQITVAAKRGETYWSYPVEAFYGAQALVWRREDAQKCAEWLGSDPVYNGVRNHGHDLLLQQWGKSLGLIYFIASAPSMVQHIGEESGIGNRFFQFGSWPGRDWRYVPKAER